MGHRIGTRHWWASDESAYVKNMRSAVQECTEVRQFGGDPFPSGDKIMCPITGEGWIPVYPFEHNDAVLLFITGQQDFVCFLRGDDNKWYTSDPSEEVWDQIRAEQVLQRMAEGRRL